MEGLAAAAAKPMIKVAAVCGSLRRGSYNRGLIRSAMELCGGKGPVSGMQIELVDIAPLPFLNTDLEVDGGGGFPAPVDAFRRKILQADAYLFASPEYNYSLSDEEEEEEEAPTGGGLQRWWQCPRFHSLSLSGPIPLPPPPPPPPLPQPRRPYEEEEEEEEAGHGGRCGGGDSGSGAKKKKRQRRRGRLLSDQEKEDEGPSEECYRLGISTPELLGGQACRCCERRRELRRRPSSISSPSGRSLFGSSLHQ